MSSLWNVSLNDYDKFPDIALLPGKLTPEFCTSNRGLRAFLNTSRRLSDDVIRQRLNSVLNNKNSPKDLLCREFLKEVIIKSWNERLKGLNYCEKVVLNSLQNQVSQDEIKINKLIENEDLKLDPYAQRDLENAKEQNLSKTNQLKFFLQNEKKIDSIVQSNSKEFITQTCGLVDLVKDL